MKNLVLFHGWGAAESVWQYQAEAFAPRMTVMTPTIPNWEVSWCYHYLQTLPLADSLLVGWSLGGMLLLETLGLLEEAPAGLVLVGAAAVFCRRPDHPWGQPPAAVRAMRRALQEDPQGLLTRFAASCLAPQEASFHQEATAHFAAPANPDHLAPGLDHLLRLDLRGRLPRLDAGVTLIHGAGDRIVPPAQARFLQAQLPGSRLHLLPGAGHLPFLTQSETFNRILMEIIEDWWSARGEL